MGRSTTGNARRLSAGNQGRNWRRPLKGRTLSSHRPGERVTNWFLPTAIGPNVFGREQGEEVVDRAGLLEAAPNILNYRDLFSSNVGSCVAVLSVWASPVRLVDKD